MTKKDPIKMVAIVGEAYILYHDGKQEATTRATKGYQPTEEDVEWFRQHGHTMSVNDEIVSADQPEVLEEELPLEPDRA